MHQSRWFKRFVLLCTSLFAAGVPLALSGCNTASGVGDDVEATGDAIQDAADDASD